MIFYRRNTLNILGMRRCASLCTLWFVILLVGLGCTANDETPLPTLARLVDAPQALTFWQTQTGTLTNAATRARWQFDAQAGDAISLRVVSRGGIAPTMTLRDADGQVIGQGNRIETTLPATGSYTVAVQLVEEGAGAYEIGLGYTDRPNPALTASTQAVQVVGVPTPTPVYANLGAFVSQITGTEPLIGELTANTPAHVYTYAGTAGDIITVEMQRIEGRLDPFLVLYNADAQALAMDDNSGENRAARLLNVRLPQDGLYTIRAWGDGFAGTYTLRLQQGQQDIAPDTVAVATVVAPTPYLTPTIAAVESDTLLVDHVPVAGTLLREGDFARYTIEAEAGEVVSFAVSPFRSGASTQPQTPLRPQFEVFDPQGALITTTATQTTNTNDSMAFIPNVTIPESGTYTLIVTGDGSTQGGYWVAYGRGASVRDVYQGELTPETRINATLLQRGGRHIWRVPLKAGTVMTIAASPEDASFDPIVELAHEDGTLIERDNDGGGERAALIRLAEIPRDGVYHIRVGDAYGGVGDYSLVWRYLTQASTPTPVPDSLAIVNIDDTVPENEYQFYTFQGTAGQRVQIRVEAHDDSPLDPVAALLAPDGRVIAQADDSGGTLNPNFVTVLPVDGTYSVRVNGYLSGGSFDLIVSLLF